MDCVAIFLAEYSLGNSPAILNLIGCLAEDRQVHLYISNVALTTCPIVKNSNLVVIDLDREDTRTQIPGIIAGIRYRAAIAIDPHGLVLCKLFLPEVAPYYYSLELYLKDDHFGLLYPKDIQIQERSAINDIKGLIIQSAEKESLFRADYDLSRDVASFILPITYQGSSFPVRDRSYLEKAYSIDPSKKIALHLGGIAPWFSCIELALTFGPLSDWVLFFQGYPSVEYKRQLLAVLRDNGVSNVVLSEELFDDIQGIDRIIQGCDVGIAWYNDISAGFRTAGLSSGKIPAYFRGGLPVIAKRYPSTLQAIEYEKSGICVEELSEIPSALARISGDYDRYSANASDTYNRLYDFNRYRETLLSFLGLNDDMVSEAKLRASLESHLGGSIKMTNKETHHFNWDKLLEGKNVADFLMTEEFWGDNQEPENPSRQAYRNYLTEKSRGKAIKILEIGFGSGIDYQAVEATGLLNGNVEYFGADVTQKFVDYARKNFSKMHAVKVDGYALPFPDNCFNTVYLRHILEHQKHYADILAEAFRVSQDVVFLNFFIEMPETGEDQINFDGTWYHNAYSRPKFVAFAAAHGFEVIDGPRLCVRDKVDAIIICKKSSGAPSVPGGSPARSCAGPAPTATLPQPGWRPLNILHTVEFYHPHIGGSETVMRQIAERLARRGHSVTVATTGLPERDFGQMNQVTVKEFSVSGNLALGFHGADAQRYLDFLGGSRFDIVMNYACQQWATDIGLLHATQSANPGTAYVIAPCGYSALDDDLTPRSQQYEEYFNSIIPYAIPGYDAAIYHSSQYKDYSFALRHGFTNSHVIPNGVGADEFESPPASDFKGAFGIGSRYMGLCVANYLPGKGHDRLIECVRRMNRDDFTLVCIGKEGELLSALQERAAGLPIRFLCGVSRQTTVSAYQAADVFLFGSEVEASPLVIIEAKASRTPFVSTDCGNVREWVGGVVCTPDQMAVNANRLLDHEVLRRQLAEEGWQEWKAKLTWESIVDQYEQLYLALAASKRAVGTP